MYTHCCLCLNKKIKVIQQKLKQRCNKNTCNKNQNSCRKLKSEKLNYFFQKNKI